MAVKLEETARSSEPGRTPVGLHGGVRRPAFRSTVMAVLLFVVMTYVVGAVVVAGAIAFAFGLLPAGTGRRSVTRGPRYRRGT